MALKVSEGFDLLMKGKLRDAVNVLKEAFEEGIATTTVHFASTINAQHLLALTLEQLSRYKEALHHSRDAYRKSVIFFGDGHPKTLLLQRTIGSVLERLKKYDEALILYRELYHKQKRNLGACHGETLITMNSVACVRAKQGNDVSLILETISNFIKGANPNEQSTLLVQCSLAVHLSKQGRFDEALEILNEVNAINNKNRPRHMDTFNCLDITAAMLSEQGKHSDALEVMESIFEKKVATFGPDHPQTLETLELLHAAENRVLLNKRLVHKLVFLNKVYRKRKDVLGAKHPETLLAQERTAEMLLDLKQYDEALSIYNTISKIKKELGINLSFKIKMNIGTALIQLGKYEEALSVYQDITKLQNNMSPDDPECMETQIGIAKTLAHQSKFDEALEIITKVGKTQECLFGPEHKLTLITRCNFATTLKMQGNCDEALKIYLEVFDVLKKSRDVGPDDELCLNILYHMANAYSVQGNLVKAHEAYTLLYAIEVPNKSGDHPNVLSIQSNIGLILALQGKYISSIEKLQEVYDKMILIFGKEHPLTLKNEKRLQCVINTMTENSNLRS